MICWEVCAFDEKGRDTCYVILPSNALPFMPAPYAVADNSPWFMQQPLIERLTALLIKEIAAADLKGQCVLDISAILETEGIEIIVLSALPKGFEVSCISALYVPFM